MLSRRVIAVVAAVSLGALAASCSSSDGESAPDPASRTGTVGETSADPPDGHVPLRVVASTDVYGDIAAQIGGDAVEVTSIISDPDADPHSYEASTRNQLALSQADIVIENGGGYDDFIDTMLAAASNPGATVLNAVDISGRTAPDGGELNEHVWYDLPTVATLADRIADALASADPDHAATFTSRADAFRQELAKLEDTEAAIKKSNDGTGVAITEPVPLYMLTACGLVNKTPEDFSEAIEEGTGVSALVLKQVLDVFGEGEVALLVYNEQATSPATDKVLGAAKDDNIPVVPVTETLPAGTDYLAWMKDNLAAIQHALG